MKFNELLENFYKNKRQQHIPTIEKYEEMIISIESASSAELKCKTQQQLNLLRHYSIRTENAMKNLYCDNKKVVKREQLFELLDSEHKKTGHDGQNVMWNALRAYKMVKCASICSIC